MGDTERDRLVLLCLSLNCGLCARQCVCHCIRVCDIKCVYVFLYIIQCMSSVCCRYACMPNDVCVLVCLR